MALTLTTDKPVKNQAASIAYKYNRGLTYSGNGLEIDGTNDYIAAGAIATSFKSIIVYVNPQTTTEKIIDFDGGTHVLEIVSGVVTATGFTSPTIYVDGISTTAISAGKWSMITVTTDTAISATSMDVGRSSTTYYDGSMSNFIMYSIL